MSKDELIKAIMQLTSIMTQVAARMIPPPKGPSDIIAAIQELNLNRSEGRMACRLLRDQHACSQFLASNNADDRRDWLLDELDYSI